MYFLRAIEKWLLEKRPNSCCPFASISERRRKNRKKERESCLGKTLDVDARLPASDAKDRWCWEATTTNSATSRFVVFFSIFTTFPTCLSHLPPWENSVFPVLFSHPRLRNHFESFQIASTELRKIRQVDVYIVAVPLVLVQLQKGVEKSDRNG